MNTPVAAELAPSVAPGRPIQRRLSWVVANPLPLVLVMLAGYFQIETGLFLTSENLTNVLAQSSILLVVAIPLAFLMLAGGVDLSIGSMAAIGGVAAASLIKGGTPELVALVAILALGLLLGFGQGALVSWAGFSPLIVTFGTLTAGRGIALAISPQSNFDFGPGMSAYGNGRFLHVPWLVWTAILVIVAAEIVFRLLPFGRAVFAIGANPRAALLSGLRVRRITASLYVLSAMAATFGGFMFIARINSAPAGTLGQGLELDALTACLLGGIAFGGGKGSPTGAVLGVLTLGVLQNGLQLMAVPTAWSLAVKGLVLVAAAGLAVVSSRARSGR